MTKNILAQLVAMSNKLGDPALDYAILGEGNSSAREDDQTFWVKVSGSELRTVRDSDFVRVKFKPVLEMLSMKGVDDAGVISGLEAAKYDASAPGRPSVETILHALALQLDGVNYVGHIRSAFPRSNCVLRTSPNLYPLYGPRLAPCKSC
jgi:rhamnose utilization protein RhaD (predicted bifunctional aldolase and dehydrogenase)